MDAKSPPPALVLTVLGAEFDLRPFPHGQMIIRITERRLQVLSTALCKILKSGCLSFDHASRIWRRLQHASSIIWGRGFRASPTVLVCSSVRLNVVPAMPLLHCDLQGRKIDITNSKTLVDVATERDARHLRPARK